MNWKIQLSSDEWIEEKGLDAWNKLIIYCKTNNLKVKKFIVNNQEIEADGYFVLYDILVIGILSGNPIQITKKGIGHFFLKHNRARIDWYNPATGEELVPEVINPITETIKNEISIYRENIV